MRNKFFFLILINIIFFYKLFSPDYFIGGDVRDYIIQSYYFKSLNTNFNNLQFCGVPSQISFCGIDYLFSFSFLNIFSAVKIAFIFHLMLLQVFAYKLFRLFSKDKFAAFTGSIIFSFSGYAGVLFLKGHNTFLYSIAWGIGMNYAFIRILRNGRFLYFSLLLICSGFQILSGNIYAIILNLILLSFLIIYEFTLLSENKIIILQSYVFKVFIIFIILIGSYLFFSKNIIESMKILDASIKKLGFTFDESKRYSYSFSHLINIVSPTFFGSSTLNNFWDKSFEDPSAYITIFIFLFLILNIKHILTDQRIFFIFISALGVLVFSMADIFPLYKILYQAIPIMRSFRAPVRFLFLFSFLNILLFVIISDKITGKNKPNKILTFFVFFCSIFIAVVGLFDILPEIFNSLNFKIRNSVLFIEMLKNIQAINKSLIYTGIFAAAYVIIIYNSKKYLRTAGFIIILAELYIFFNTYAFIRFNPSEIYKNELFIELTKLDKNNRIYFDFDFRNINDHIFYNLKSIRAYNPAMPVDFLKFVSRDKSGNTDFSYEKLSNRLKNINIESEYFDMLNAKYFVTARPKANNKFRLLKIIGNYYIYENLHSWNYVEIFEDFSTINYSEKNYLKVNTKKIFLNDDKIARSNNDGVSVYNYAETSSKGKFLILFSATVTKPSLIFLPIIYDKNFKALVNKYESKIIPVNNFFMCIPINAGSNNVELIYNPDYSFSSFRIIGIAFIIIGFYLRRLNFFTRIS